MTVMERVVLLLLVALLGLAFLRYVWPWACRTVIRWRSLPHPNWLQRRFRFKNGFDSAAALAITFLILTLPFWVVLNYPGIFDIEKLLDPQPMALAMGLAATLMFGHAKYFAPSLWPNFRRVRNLNTGAIDRERVTELRVPVGCPWPVFLEVHNTGISTWENYRITVEAETGRWKFFTRSVRIPSDDWEWNTIYKPNTVEGQSFLQMQATNTLTAGEGQTMRFFVEVPEPGTFRLRVMVVCKDRIGETRVMLKVKAYRAEGDPLAAVRPTSVQRRRLKRFRVMIGRLIAGQDADGKDSLAPQNTGAMFSS